MGAPSLLTKALVRVGACVLLAGLARPVLADDPKPRFFATGHGNWEWQNYVSLETGDLPNGSLSAHPPAVTGAALPSLVWNTNTTTDEYHFTVIPEGDQNVKTAAGDAVIFWKAPGAGNWKISLSAKNIGAAVKGGDGGIARVTLLRPADKVDNTEVFALLLGPSTATPETIENTAILKLEAGDIIALRFSANLDSFGDQFEVIFHPEKTDEAGKVLVSREYDSFIADPPATSAEKGVPMRSGLFWLGTDGGWSNSAFAEESIKLVREFIPDLAVVMVANKPEIFKQPAFYRESGIPTLIQNWGAGYEPFFKAKGAFEKNWDGRDLSEPHVPGLVQDLSSTAHAISPPHPETRRAFQQLLQSSIRSGYSGFGVCDMVWLWGLGSGAAGYNPKTIEAFQQDLQGKDEGLHISMNGMTRTIKLDDYIKYYFGASLLPASFGYKTWAEYAPPAKANYPGNAWHDYAPEFLLFDLLQHYEWLKWADFLGRSAQKEGGFFQCMPNPEDITSGNDFLFLSSLDSVLVRSEEYFGGVEFMGGAYYHFPYLASPTSPPRQTGVVVEGGGGGNYWPYYVPEVAYVTAYELTLATGADQMEADFWPNARAPLDQLIKDRQFRMRYQSLLAYGLGFKNGKEDNARQVKPDFLSVTSRRLFRPWVTTWMPWNWYLNIPGSPDLILAKGGYAFRGIGEEGIQALSGKENVVLYSPAIGTEKGWTEFLARLKDGRIGTGIVVASGAQSVVGTDLKIKPVSTVTPDFALEERRGALRSGKLTGAEDKEISETEYDLRGPLYKAGTGDVILSLDGDPIVSKRSIGAQTLYTLLFDPSNPANADLAAVVYQTVLDQVRIKPRWTTPAGTTARLYQNGDLLIASVHGPALFDRSYDKKPVEERQFPYAVSATLEAKIKAAPNARYLWLGLPSAMQGEVTADADGYLNLSMTGVSCQIFYLLPKTPENQTRIQQLAKRSEIFKKAMTVGGRVTDAVVVP